MSALNIMTNEQFNNTLFNKLPNEILCHIDGYVQKEVINDLAAHQAKYRLCMKSINLFGRMVRHAFTPDTINYSSYHIKTNDGPSIATEKFMLKCAFKAGEINKIVFEDFMAISHKWNQLSTDIQEYSQYLRDVYEEECEDNDEITISEDEYVDNNLYNDINILDAHTLRLFPRFIKHIGEEMIINYNINISMNSSHSLFGCPTWLSFRYVNNKIQLFYYNEDNYKNNNKVSYTDVIKYHVDPEKLLKEKPQFNTKKTLKKLNNSYKIFEFCLNSEHDPLEGKILDKYRQF